MSNINDLKHEIIIYFADLHTSLEIVTIKGGRFSEWLRDNRPAIRMIWAFMLAHNLLYAYFATSKIYEDALIAVSRLRWSQGQQKSLPVAMRLIQQAYDAMYEAGWYKEQASSSCR